MGTSSRASDGDAGIGKGFDVAEHAPSSAFQTWERFVVGPFLFEGSEEAFHNGVVVAASGAAHGALDAERLQGVLVVVAGALTATITVVQQVSAGGAACLDRAAQNRADEFRRQRMAHGPAHHLATEQIEHNGQVNPSL